MTAPAVHKNSNQTSIANAPAVDASRRFQLQARTAAGDHLVRIAEEQAERMSARAADHDREATYPFKAIDELKEAGYFAAPVPLRFGGMDVESVHDILVASSRLARGDASVTIGVNMHLAAVVNVAHGWRQAIATGAEPRAERLGGMLHAVSHRGIIMAAAVSEPAQDLTRPATTAVRRDGRLEINGQKIFCTMSPAATLVYVAVTIPDPGGDRYAYVMVPKNTPGVTVNNDWDALGMRASGSHSVTFERVVVPEAAVYGTFPAGQLSYQLMETNFTAGAFHASASLGIAEEAARQAAAMIGKKKQPGARDVMLAAENAVDISAMRSIFSRAGTIIDDFMSVNLTADATFEEMTELYGEIQSAKIFINEASVRVVDRALAMSGGAGYMSKHPLSRAYRDVRAGAFMHPLGANRGYEFVGQVAIGTRPDLK